MLGEVDCPAAIVTVRDWPVPLVVTSCATAVLVWLTVTVTLGAPGPQRLDTARQPPDAFSTPMLTENASSGESVVVDVGQPAAAARRRRPSPCPAPA